ISIKDTAWVRPNNFIYRITITKEVGEKFQQLEFSNPNAFRMSVKKQGDRNKLVLDSIKSVLEKDGFTILSPFLYNQIENGNNAYKIYYLDVLTGTEDSLKSLSGTVSKSSSLSGNIISVFSTNETQ